MNETLASQVEKYLRVTECIGHGIFSTVYRIQHVNNNRSFALKKVSLNDINDEKIRLDCINEVNLLQNLHHPNIIRYVYSEYGATDGTLKLVLELASLGDLNTFISNQIRLTSLVPEKKIWKFATHLSSALDYIHANRIVHRDLKPANIFLSGNEDIKIGDFGMAEKCPDEAEPYFESVLGTPYYMSPERLLQKRYSFNCDVWSLGCVIYELAALQSPFYVNKLDINLLIKRVVKCDHPPLPCDVYTKELNDVIAKCLTVDCEKRPNAREIFGVASQVYKSYANEFIKKRK